MKVLRLKKSVKKGLIVVSLYLIAVISTFIINERVGELDNGGDFRNTNSSIKISFSK